MKKSRQIYPFIIVLKHTQAGMVRTTGLLLALLAILVFILTGVQSGNTGLQLVLTLPAIIYLAWNGMETIKKRKVKYAPILLYSGVCLLVLPPHVLIGLMFIVAGLIERIALVPPEIGFADDHIRFNGLLKKNYKWTDFRAIILKDGVLTLDFSDNRLLQKFTDDEESDEYDGDEEEFNQYCRNHLAV
jgi:hypothetical protein